MTERDFEYFGRVNAISARDDISDEVKQAQVFSTMSELGTDAGSQVAFATAVHTATHACQVSLGGETRREAELQPPPPVTAPAPSTDGGGPELNLAGRFPDCGPDRAWRGEVGDCRPVSELFPDRDDTAITQPVWTSQPTPDDFARYYPSAGRGALNRPLRVILSCIIDRDGRLACSAAYVGAAPNNALNVAFSDASLRLARHYTMAAQLADGSQTAGQSYWLNIVWQPQ
jgi:hypothetical protein